MGGWTPSIWDKVAFWQNGGFWQNVVPFIAVACWSGVLVFAAYVVSLSPHPIIDTQTAAIPLAKPEPAKPEPTKPQTHDQVAQHVSDMIQSWMDEDFKNGKRFKDDPLDNCRDPCRIRYNAGGQHVSFVFAARTLHERKPHGAIIDGGCYSACSLFADLGRPYVCVTKQAAFYFHRSWPDELIPPYAPDIKLWVMAHGGFPKNRSHQFREMKWPETQKFWPMCGDTPQNRAAVTDAP
jgi:hypothetical protein